MIYTGYWSLTFLDHANIPKGAKRLLNGTSKVNRHTDGQTDRQTDGHFDLQKVAALWADALKLSKLRNSAHY